MNSSFGLLAASRRRSGGGPTRPTFVQAGPMETSSAAYSGHSTSIVLSSPLVTGYIVFMVAWFNTDLQHPATVTFNGSPMTLLAFHNNGAYSELVALYGIPVGALAAGTYTTDPQWTLGYPVGYWVSGIFAYDGVDQSSPVSGGHGAAGSVSTTGTDTISSNASSLVVSAVECDSGSGATVFTAGSGGTIRGQAYQAAIAAALADFPGAASVTTGWTNDTGGISSLAGFSLQGG